jgi:hypothetical protein
MASDDLMFIPSFMEHFLLVRKLLLGGEGVRSSHTSVFDDAEIVAFLIKNILRKVG